jgi:hypothetical protein
MRIGTLQKTGAVMPVAQSNVESYSPGQRVRTSFGPGIVKAVSHIDSILYVTLANDPAGLYIFHPEQVEAVDEGG